MFRKILAVVVVPILVLLTVLVLSQQPNQGLAQPIDWWPMFHHDSALSGTTASTAPDTNQVLWTYDTGSLVGSSPAIVDGVLYIGSLGSPTGPTIGTLHALNADTGLPIWTYATDGPVWSSPAVAEGKVYFLSTDGYFYAVDASTGALIWRQGGMEGPWSWSSPAVHDGRVFVAASNGWIHGFAATGSWSTFIGGNPNGPIAVANGKVYSGTHDSSGTLPIVVALDELTGATVGTYYRLGMINSNGVAVVDGDHDGNLELYFGTMGGEAVALDEATGTVKWTQNLNGPSSSTPAVHNGRVYIGSDDTHIYALDAGTGAYVWSFPTGGEVYSAPAVADGKVFFGSLDHKVYALDEATGGLVWNYDTGASRIYGSPAVADGKVFVGNENGKVYAFGSPPGPVGGIAELPDIAGAEAAMNETASTNYALWAAIAAGATIGAIGLGAGLWYTRRRLS